MDELFNILSSSARINKSKKKKKVAPPSSTVLISQPISHATSDMEDDGEGGRKSRDLTGKRDRTPAKLDQIHREDVAAFRNRLSVRLSAANRHDLTLSDPITTFDELAQPAWWLHQPQLFSAVKNTLLKNIEMGKWTEPTPIQMQSIPTLLEKRDTLGCAPTGSGKSGAFIIPALFIGSAPQSVFYNTSVASKSDSGDGGKKKKKKNKHQEKHGDPDTEGGIRTLLLAPSRELAAQLHREVVRLGDGKIHGLKSVLLSKPNAGVVISGKAGGKRGLDVLVSTPLRLVECIRQGLDLSHVRLVVLDEADRLLDVADGGGTKHTNDEKNMDQINDLKDGSISEDSESSEEEVTPQNSKNQADPIQQQQSGSRQTQTFLAQIDAILSHIPTSAIRGLFSATITPPVRSLSESMLRNPVDITIGGGSSGPSANTDIDQKLMFVGREEGKLLAIRQITQKGIKPPVIIFLESKDRAQALFGELMYDGIRVDVIHAGRSQSARDEAVAKFRRGETWVLICTDLVARGVDFKAVNMVINYDLPTSGVTYVHRIGRTGRAGRKGEAITFFTESDFDNLRTIANVMKLSGCEVPAWMLSLKKSQTRGGSSTGHTNHKAKKKHTTDRRRIETTPAYDNVTKYKKKQNIEQSMKRKRSSNEATKSSTPVKSSSNMGKKKKAKNSK